jgi:PAS domain S-box-containing protein
MTAESVLASVMDAVVVIDPQQRIVFFNRAAEQVFGVPAAVMLGKNINQLLPERFRAAHAEHIARYAETGSTTRNMLGGLATLTGLRADGEEFPLEATISQVVLQKDKLLTVILRDMTERKAAEQALRNAPQEVHAYREALEKAVAERTVQLRETISELETFTYSLVHDMRAPLRAVRSFAAFLREDCGERLGKEGVSYLDRIERASQHLGSLVEGVLSYSRMAKEQMRLQPVDVEKLLRDVIAERPALRPPQAEVDIESPLPPMVAHSAALARCLGNLLDNAAKFVGPGTKPHIRIRSAPVGGHVRLWIEDNGIGIPPAAQGRLFGMFQRVHRPEEYPGAGVGLAIVRKGVERMGGKVGVESEPGKGSRFWIELPAVKPR